MSYWNAFSKKYPSRAVLRLDGGSIFNPGTAESPVVSRWVLEGTYRSKLDALNLSASDLPIWQELAELAAAGELPKEFLEVPLVSANVTPKVSSFPALKRYIIKEYQLAGKGAMRLSVGVTGLLFDPEERIPRTEFQVEKPETAARAVIEELENKANFRIILTDMTVGKAMSLAVTVPGINLVLVSHNYDAIADPQEVGDTLVVLSVNEGRMLNEIRLALDPVTSKMNLATRFIQLDGAIPDDPVMGELQRKARAAVDELKKQKSLVVPSEQPGAQIAKSKARIQDLFAPTIRSAEQKAQER